MPPCSPRRRAFSLIEASIAVILLLSAMTLTVRVVAAIALERRSADRRLVAIREADNLLERITDGHSIAEGPLSLSPEGAGALRGGAVTVDRVLEGGDGPPLERITVTVRYRERGDIMAAPVRLTTWVAAESVEAGEDSP